MRANSLASFGALVCASLASLAAAPAHAAATITILNINAPNVGFNDPTPVAPVGGNLGTTLGQQRLNAFQYAASLWGATLTSSVTIVVQAQFSALACNATGAVLGSAGPISISRDFVGAPLPATWYHIALANKLFGADRLPANPDINANFNVNLGNPGCLTGIPFYLGLDNNHGTAVDLVTVLLHEFGHGLGFSTVTNGTTGAYFSGFPSSYDHFLFDNTVNKTWVEMTPAERATSAVNTRRLVWTGTNVGAAAPTVLNSGTPQFSVIAPASAAGTFLVGLSQFGPPLSTAGVTGEIMPVVDSAGGLGLACTPLSAVNAAAVNGKIAVVDRGVCIFTDKVKNAQNAGAIAVVIVDNVAGSPPPGNPGIDATVVIPSVRITQAEGATLKNALRFRSRTRSGVFGTMGINAAVLTGADANGRMLMFTPNPFAGGSSVSHWDQSASRNQLMEPNINGDLTHSVLPPEDLTFRMLQDIGW